MRNLVLVTISIILCSCQSLDRPAVNFYLEESKSYSAEISRDIWGVPHVHGKTDADAAFGLAFAHAEDDFKTIQQGYLAGNSLLSDVEGKKALGIDFIAQFIGSDRLYEQKYLSDVSDEYKSILEAYCDGINRFAEIHPEQVLSKKLFPINTKSLFLYGQLQLFVSSKGDYWVKKILKNKLNYEPVKDEVKGSNTFAFNSSKTKDGNTYLAINTHQPLDGPTSWYEVHLNSEEGTDIIGALFAGSPNVIIGENSVVHSNSSLQDCEIGSNVLP